MAHIIGFPEHPSYSIRGRIIVGWVGGTFLNTNRLTVVDSIPVDPNATPQQRGIALADALLPHAITDSWVPGRHDRFSSAIVLANEGPEAPHNMQAIYITEAHGRIDFSELHAPGSGERLSITASFYGYQEPYFIPGPLGRDEKGLALGVAEPSLQYDHLNEEYGEIHRWTPADREHWLDWIGFTPA